jgi:NAD(P)-dependent dehydrogenase (short-subunit alcohol dehydrogenase family)
MAAHTRARWTLAQVPRLEGKTVVVTGANSGIGFAAARIFADAGASVVLACRNAVKAAAAAAAIRAEIPNATVSCMPLDLASLDSVRVFADAAREQLPRIDVLCNNAGVMAIPYATTVDGFECQLGTNHLGHFALTGLLFEQIAASAPARIVTVSSLAHKSGRVNFDDLQGTRMYDRRRAYGQSKLANLLFTYELDRRLRAHGLDVMAVACHPGVAETELIANSGTGHGVIMTVAIRLFRQSAVMGALPLIYAAIEPSVQGGDYIGPSGPGETRGLPHTSRSSPSSYDAAVAKELWTVSEQLTGVRFL